MALILIYVVTFLGERKSMSSDLLLSRIEGQLDRTATVTELFILITGVHLPILKDCSI